MQLILGLQKEKSSISSDHIVKGGDKSFKLATNQRHPNAALIKTLLIDSCESWLDIALSEMGALSFYRQHTEWVLFVAERWFSLTLEFGRTKKHVIQGTSVPLELMGRHIELAVSVCRGNHLSSWEPRCVGLNSIYYTKVIYLHIVMHSGVTDGD